MLYIFILILIIVIIIGYFKIGGGTSLEDKILDLLDSYGMSKDVNKYLQEHFDLKGSTVSIVNDVIRTHKIKSVNDFIKFSAFSQCAIMPDNKFAFVARAYKYNKIGKKDIDMLVKFGLSVSEAIDILTAHRFYKIKDEYIKWPLTKLKKNKTTVFELDEIPYRPIIEQYKLFKHSQKAAIDLKDLIEALYSSNPKLYTYSELRNIYTINDFINYLRRKSLAEISAKEFLKKRVDVVKDLEDEAAIDANDAIKNTPEIQDYLNQIEQEKETTEKLIDINEIDKEEQQRILDEIEEKNISETNSEYDIQGL